MDNYTVEIWKMEERGKHYGSGLLKENIIAKTPELALQKALTENKIHFRVYAEVVWNDGQERKIFENYLVEV